MTDATLHSSYDVRAELEDRLQRDLLGPADGPEEELPPDTEPAERYLLGRLVPCRPDAHSSAEPVAGDPPDGADPDADGEEVFDREVTTGVEAEADDDPPSQASVRTGTMAASAIGLGFSVPADVDQVLVTAEWGRYQRAPSAVHVTDQGQPRTVWRRVPVTSEPCAIDLRHQGEGRCPPVPEYESVELRWVVRHRDALRVVDLALVNAQEAGTGPRDESRLYQVALTVTAADGTAAVFVGHNDPELRPLPTTGEPERLHLELLYRDRREYAHGRQCAVDAEVRAGEHRAWRLRTTSFPAADVELTVAADAAAMPGVELDMAALGDRELSRDDLVRVLRPLVAGYRMWLTAQAAHAAGDPEIRRYTPAPAQALAAASSLADRLDRAIDLVRDNPLAREAFRFANQAMALQRVRSELVRTRLADPEANADALFAELDVPRNRSWRPFQLAFVLLCIPGLTDPTHPDAHRGIDDGQVQLLFFPTGGGKTEAYLGLTAFTFAIRRLQGVVGSGDEARDGTDGVAVLMRYTLRLLTAQQFQRAASLVCACEFLRRRLADEGDARWGTTPFRVGLWVGAGVSPNSFEEARRQIEDRRSSSRSTGGVVQLVACPWCGSALGYADVRADAERRRVILSCSDPEGDCLFSRRRSPTEGLPVLTVDEEIYRLTPALVIATVDKLAQLPWKAATGLLFGVVAERCPRHGWRCVDFDSFCKPTHRARGRFPASSAGPAMRVRPPDLVIQDELHLITDALGSMVGLYETVVDRLCSRVDGGSVVRPVVVASSATVRRATDQVEQVFARSVEIFPPQILDAGATFFSRAEPPSPVTPSRRYRGILATGERMPAIEIRVVGAILEHAQDLFDRYGLLADPYMTVVDYFTATRELAGMRRLVEDDIADRLASHKVRTRRRRPTVSELTSRMPSDRIAATLGDLDRSFDPLFDSTAARDAFRAERRANPAAPPQRSDRRGFPLDVLLATSMLQVGVDVPRLGMMVVTGQPKNTAEYIQATSRVGRDPARPGLVVTIYEWHRPRDLAHFEGFGAYHSTFGKRIEGLTTTPFSDRALDRGLTGVLVSSIRHARPDTAANGAAQQVALDGPSVDGLLDEIERRADRVTHDRDTAAGVRRALVSRLDRWKARRAGLGAGTLGYEEAADVVGLLRPPEESPWGTWSAPRSLREVEPEVILQLDRGEVQPGPSWSYDEGVQP